MPMSEVVDYALKVRSGAVVDPSVHLVLYAAAPEDDPYAEETWPGASPAVARVDHGRASTLRTLYESGIATSAHLPQSVHDAQARGLPRRHEPGDRAQERTVHVDLGPGHGAGGRPRRAGGPHGHRAGHGRPGADDPSVLDPGAEDPGSGPPARGVP